MVLVHADLHASRQLLSQMGRGVAWPRLTLASSLDGVAVVAARSDLAAIDAREPGTPVAGASDRHAEWIDPLDFLFAGIR